MRENAHLIIEELRREGIKKTALITGDLGTIGNEVGNSIGMDEVISDLLPHQKAGEIKRLRKNHGQVVMVGDGINDAPALAQADLGIAIGSGTDVAMESAGIVLMRNSLNGVVTAIELSRAVLKNIKQNLFWAFGYNIIGIPIAAGVVYLFGGPTLNPMFAAAAMAMSSVSVVTNALRLKGYNPPGAFVSTEQINQTVSKEKKMKTEISIKGMSCQHCVKNVTEKLNAVEGVTSTNVDLEKKQAIVESSRELDQTLLKNTITDAGYSVTGIRSL